MQTYTHVTVVDGEPVNIVSRSVEGRGENFCEVEGAHGRFVAHKNDLAPFVAKVQARGGRERDEEN